MPPAKKGLRVVRGPDWKWGEQDGGEGGVGTIIADCTDPNPQSPSSLFSSILSHINTERRKDEGFVTVIWDNGVKGVYRAGAQGAYDLRVVDSCANGVKHSDESCHSCLTPEILGMRWQCTICNANFCSSCFYEIKTKERHEHYEIFMRYDSPDSEPVLITVMSNQNETIQLKGIYMGAKVKRGAHWSYGDEDDGQIGEVMASPSEDPRNQKNNNKVYVKWRSNSSCYLPYRRGEDGKMDVKVVECAVGGRYHPEWLPVLRATSDVNKEFGKTVSATSHFSVGDLVKLGLTLDAFREKQSECGGWNPLMAKLINQTGTVSKVNENLVQVNFDGSDRKWSLNPTVLTKLSQFSVGQIVRVKEDDETLKMMQLKLGNKMAYSMIGETGTITSIEIGGNNEEENVFLALTDIKTTNPQSMRPDWLEAIPGSAKLQEKFSRMKSDMVNLFIEAAGEGDFHLTRELINNYKVPVDAARKSDGVTALHLACRNGHLKLIQWLLEEKKADIEKADSKGRRAIYFTIKGCQPEVLNLLIKKGAEPDPLTLNKKLSPLLKAAAKQYTELAQILIKTNCCNVNLQDGNGNTALHLAVIGRRKSELFDALLQCDRTDLTIRNEMGYNVFHSAVISGNLEVLKFILDSKHIALTVERVTCSHYSALHLASLTGDLKIVQFLLDRLREKLSVDEEDSMGNTALMIASGRCHYGLIELLTKSGKANVKKMNFIGQSPVSLVMKKIGIIQRVPLSEDSPDIHKVYAELFDEDKDTISKYPSLAAVCYLIDKGGRLEVKENKVNDQKVWQLLKSFLTKYQMEVEDSGYRRLVVADEPCHTCILCPNQVSSNITYKCCNQKSSTCADCYACLRYCPGCKKPMESFRRKYYRSDSNHIDDLMDHCGDDIYLNSYSKNIQPDLPLKTSKEIIPIVPQKQNPEKIIATNILPSSIIRPTAASVHQVAQISSVIPNRQFAVTYPSSRPTSIQVLSSQRIALTNFLPKTNPIIMTPTSASSTPPSQPVGAASSTPPFQPVRASAPATVVHRRPLILMRAGVPPQQQQSSPASPASGDKNVVEISFMGKSRRGSDKIVDSLGNSYTKRFKSAGVWQCTRQQGGNSKNRCSAVIKEKDGKFFLVKGTHSHGGNDKNDTSATSSINLSTV